MARQDGAGVGSIVFVPTFKDALTAQRLAGRRSYLQYFGIIAFFVCAIAFHEFSSTGSAWATLFVTASYTIGSTILFLGSYYLYTPHRVKKLFTQRAIYRKNVVIAWDVAGYHIRWEDGAYLTPWIDRVARRENQHVLLFYLTDNLYDFVPKRLLTREQLVSILACSDAVPKMR